MITAWHDNDVTQVALIEPASSKLTEAELVDALQSAFKDQGWCFSVTEGYNVCSFIEDVIHYQEVLPPESVALLERIS